jgi:hypothetical protein
VIFKAICAPSLPTSGRPAVTDHAGLDRRLNIPAGGLLDREVSGIAGDLVSKRWFSRATIGQN